MSGYPRHQRILFITSTFESLLQLTPQDPRLSLDFTNTSVLLDARLFMHCSSAHSKMFICSCAASAASAAGDASSTLQNLCAGTSTSASRCCSSAFVTNSSTSSPCLFWPRLSAVSTRFAPRSSSVFVSPALDTDPARVP